MTCEPVPGRVVKTWHPNFSKSSGSVLASKEYMSEISDLTHTDDETFSSLSPTPSHHSAACGNTNVEEKLCGSYTVKTGELLSTLKLTILICKL